MTETSEHVHAELIGLVDSMSVADRREGSLSYARRVLEIAQALASVPSFEPFDATMAVLGGSGRRLSYELLASWLAQRGQEVGGEQAIADVCGYLASPFFPAWAVLLLAGPKVEERYDLGDRVALLPFEELPARQLRASAWSSQQAVPLSTPAGALALRFDHPRHHDPRNRDSPVASAEPGLVDPHFETLEDALLGLIMCRNGGCEIQATVRTVAADDSVPAGLGGIGWWHHDHRPTRGGAPIIGHEASKAGRFLSRFRQLSAENQDRLRVSIRFLGIAASTMDHVEHAAALRTALEVLYLKPREKNKKVKISKRVAGFLPFDSGDSEAAEKRFVETYEICCHAIHEGRLPSQPDNLTALLAEAQRAVHDTIWKLVEMSEIRWPFDLPQH